MPDRQSPQKQKSYREVLQQINHEATMIQRGEWRPFTIIRREGNRASITLVLINRQGNIINKEKGAASHDNVICDICHRVPRMDLTIIRCPHCLTDTKTCELGTIHCRHCGKIIRNDHNRYL